MNFKKLLDELYKLTQIEEHRRLTTGEVFRYMEIVTILQDSNIEIPFAINY